VKQSSKLLRRGTDRRVQKTKKLLSQALVDLILQKGYENVTVQDILDRANVGRSTFYAHYENKELLLVDGPRNLGFTLFGQETAVGFTELFQHVGRSLPLAKAMVGKESGAIIVGSFRAQIEHVITERYKSRYTATAHDSLVLTYLARAGAAMVASLLQSWVDDDLALKAEEMSAQCQRVIEGLFA
jgi:AcrR family transcriptional regulator